MLSGAFDLTPAYGILEETRCSLPCDGQQLALGCIEPHLPVVCPLEYPLQVLIKLLVITVVFDLAIQNGVVSEESDFGRDVISNVIDV